MGVTPRWLWQVVFWALLWFMIPILFSDPEHMERQLYRSTVIAVGVALTVFLNLKYFLPFFFFRKQYFLYGLVSLGALILILFLIEWDGAPWAEYFNRRGKWRRSSYFSVMKMIVRSIPLSFSLLGSMIIEMARYTSHKEKEAIAFQKEKLETEMKFLKSQTNPHFLFNALNNIYTLTVIKSDAAPENLLKLSGMLRYMLYDCKEERVPLSKEIEYIRNYIDLNLLKDSKGLNVNVSLDERHPDLPIAPLLFIPYIENAFKHSKIEDLKEGWINIKLEVKEKILNFRVENSIPATTYTKDKAGGIGLKNAARQLELAYPDKHELTVQQDDRQFTVSLKIDLS